MSWLRRDNGDVPTCCPSVLVTRVFRRHSIALAAHETRDVGRRVV
ncbi:MAG TPA: hypothetical protein VHF67_05715 [Gaiellaceae bacterium]|nr:hypothetical protein [Gaiellaceae bacterium]